MSERERERETLASLALCFYYVYYTLLCACFALSLSLSISDCKVFLATWKEIPPTNEVHTFVDNNIPRTRYSCVHTMFLDCLLLCVLVLASVSNARGITRGFHREFSNGMTWHGMSQHSEEHVMK